MSLFSLVLRNLAQRPLSSVLTALNVALGVMLVSAVLSLRAEVERSYARQSEGFSLVVGPAGSGLELVLNTIYHVGESRGLVPFSTLRELESEEWKPYVRDAVPWAVGDSFRGFRVVATTDAVFGPSFPQPPGTITERFASGGPFGFDRGELEGALKDLRLGRAPGEGVPLRREAVLGHEVATRLGLGVGSEIEPSHGVEGDHEHEGEAHWRVTGVLRRTGTPIDRVVLINLDSFYRITEHAGGIVPASGEPGLSAILVFPRPGFAKGVVLGNLRKRADLQVADVPTEIRRLLDWVGDFRTVFLILAGLVVLVGVVSIAVAVYNTMNERRREIAILRALGARRGEVLRSVVLEAALLALCGAAAGLVFAHLGMGLAGDLVERAAGIRPEAGLPGLEELGAALLVVLGAAVAGLLPAWKGYRTDVARHLAPPV